MNGGSDSSTVAPPKEAPIPFTAQSRSVHLYRPSKSKDVSDGIPASTASILSPLSTSSPPPAAVLIMGWMDAPLRIVSKYAAIYAKLFPDAPILIKLSSGKAFVAKKEVREAPLANVVEILQDINTSKTSGEGILIHSFSDGGSHNLTEFLRLTSGKKVPAARAMIFDCSPGISSPYTSATAFTVPLAKRPFIRRIVWIALYIYFRTFLFLKQITGTKTWSQIMRANLNNPKRWSSVYPSNSAKGACFPPRMYLYTKGDELISWKAVELHAKEAASMQGLSKPISLEDIKSSQELSSGGPVVAWRRWDEAKHCDLIRADYPGYVTAIRSFLEGVL